jgi:peroxiredoxin
MSMSSIRSVRRGFAPSLLAAFVALACQSGTADAAPPPAPATAAASAAAAPASAATVGKPAPDFTLPALDGAATTLSAHKGKIVVLEWFNPECPFVRAAHTEGVLKDMAAKTTDVVWLAINSGAPGKQGADPEVNRKAKAEWALNHPILLDADGKVGRLYGAQRTPHLMIVDAAGTLVYRGGLDNTGSGRPSDANPFINHVEAALTDLRAGKPVAVPESKVWGCSVKYGS